MTTPVYPFICWDNRFHDAVPVASSTALGAALNLADFRPYTQWQPAALPATVTVDSGSAQSADTLGVFNHNLFSNGNTIEVHGSTDNFATSDVTLSSFTPTSDLPFVQNFASASYRYWRIRILNGTAPTLSIVALGVGLQFPTGLPYGFSPLDRKIFAQTNISEQGLPLGSAVLFEQWTQQLTFNYVANTWLRATLLPAWKAWLRGNPFLFAFDLTNFPAEIYLVQTDGNLTMPSAFALMSDVNITLLGVALP